MLLKTITRPASSKPNAASSNSDAQLRCAETSLHKFSIADHNGLFLPLILLPCARSSPRPNLHFKYLHKPHSDKPLLQLARLASIRFPCGRLLHGHPTGLHRRSYPPTRRDVRIRCRRKLSQNEEPLGTNAGPIYRQLLHPLRRHALLVRTARTTTGTRNRRLLRAVRHSHLPRHMACCTRS